MKKTVLALITLVCLTKAVNAQTGSILVYGNIGFNANGKNGGAGSYTDNGGKGSFYINPGVGYQLNNNWTVGVEGGYDYYDNGGITKTSQAGAFLRYAKPIAGIFSWYTQLGLGYQGVTSGSPSVTNSGFYAYVSPSISAAVHNGLAVNFTFGKLEYSSWKNSVSTFGLNFNNGVTVGISKNFGGK